MSDHLLLRFANEEMICLLHLLHIPDFPGLAPEPLKSLTESEKALLISSADHTLRARGLVQWRDGTERAIDPLVSNLLQECARPRYTLFLDMLEAGSSIRQRLYLFGEKVTVEQCEPEPGVQQYLLLSSREDVAQRLLASILLEQAEGSALLPGGELEADLWKQALKLAFQNPVRAASLLATRLPNQTAQAIAAAIHDLQQVQYLALWKQTPSGLREDPLRAMTLVRGQNQFFLLWMEDPENGLLQALPANAETVWKYLARLIPLHAFAAHP